MNNHKKKSERYWKKKLTPEQYEAPLANASGIFSAGFVGAKSAEAKNSSHSSPYLWFDDTHHPEPVEGRPWFSAKADKILRQKGTEPPFTGELLRNYEKGVYECMACGAPLFSSETKYDSKSGWPSFYDSLNAKNIELDEDLSLGMRRIEVKCANCHSHLGHLFEDGPNPTGKRYCINSAALNFAKKK